MFNQVQKLLVLKLLKLRIQYPQIYKMHLQRPNRKVNKKFKNLIKAFLRQQKKP
jgi:hypothetical protein